MATVDVKDAAGSTVAIEKPLTPGRAAAAASRPVALSSEDAAFLDGLETLITATNALLTTQAAYLDGLETLITSTNTKLDTLHADVGVAPTVNSGVNGSGVQRVTLATDDAVPVALAAIQLTGKTCSVSVTRPNDTNTYAANDALSDSTSAPTSGGYTLTGAARASGGTGIITDILITSSADPALNLQGEIWIADGAMTNVNDNAAFAMADADVLNLVAVVPFALVTTVAGSSTNSYAHLTGLGIGYTCVGSANLRFLLKVKNAYIPIAQEVFQVRAKVQYTS